MNYYSIGHNGIVTGRGPIVQSGEGNSVLKNDYNPEKEGKYEFQRPYFQAGLGEKYPERKAKYSYTKRTKYNFFDTLPRPYYQRTSFLKRGEYAENVFSSGLQTHDSSTPIEIGEKTLDKIFGAEEGEWDGDVLKRDKYGKPIKTRPMSIQKIIDSNKSVGKKIAKINKYIKDNDGMLSVEDKKSITDAVNDVMDGINLNTNQAMDKLVKELRKFSSEIGKIDRSVFTFSDIIKKEEYREKAGSILNFLINNAMYNNNKGPSLDMNTPLYTAVVTTAGTTLITSLTPMPITKFSTSLNSKDTLALNVSDINNPIYAKITDMERISEPYNYIIDEEEFKEDEEDSDF